MVAPAKKVAPDPKVVQVYRQMLGYRKDPVGFAINVLGVKEEHIWSKMVELLEGVRDHQKVAVRAGHSVSKTHTVGNIVVPWFKTCFQPSTIVTTGPSDNQVRNQLWREIHGAYAGSKVPLGGEMHTLMWDHKPSKTVLDSLEPDKRKMWEKNFAVGFTTSPDTCAEHATKMQGWHNEWVLVVLDEACGIMPQIWRTALQSLIIDEQCKILALGNPTDPESDFAKACFSSDIAKNDGNEPYISDEGFYVITISGMDTPNYKERRRVIPGLAGYDYVKSIVDKHGINGDVTRYRVRGLFPTFKEGTYYGAKLAQANKDGRIGMFPHEPNARVHTFNDYGDMYTATLFVQFLGGMIRIIDDYWDYEGLGLPAWAKMCTSKPYQYGHHFAGPDLVGSNRKSFQTGKATQDVAAELGFHLTPVITHSFDDGIEAVRGIWSKLQVHKENCGTFLSAAAGYGKEPNRRLSTDDQVVYHDSPAKTWHRHMADALRHLAIAYRYMEIGGDVLGSTRAKPEINSYVEDYNPLLLGRL